MKVLEVNIVSPSIHSLSDMEKFLRAVSTIVHDILKYAVNVFEKLSVQYTLDSHNRLNAVLSIYIPDVVNKDAVKMIVKDIVHVIKEQKISPARIIIKIPAGEEE